MIRLLTLPDRIFARFEHALSGWFLATAARLVFAGVLLMYFWNSAATKLGDGILGLFKPSSSAYIQIFPKAFEAAGYDPSQLGFFHWLVAVAGTWAEFILPFLILIGLLTRLAALGMIGFVFVQSIVDITGHGLDEKSIGAWFDGPSDALIMDQRAFWVLLLLILVVRGAGPLSIDGVLGRKAAAPEA
ncbi:DoxX family protein [Alphaproteobacteria bacterium KMM 3653]|uniref:DoxX family protein n=1 Tax=Harenicola maris TaxID=2841044 RepID=A0AAP2CM32_9RHOB|nr:DoxX family protein [Harenicola maris]